MTARRFFATLAGLLAAFLLLYGQPNPLAGGVLFPYTTHLAGEHPIVLTFDDGPDPLYTPQVLEALAHYDIKATFFVLGQHAEEYPHLVRQMAAQGHVVGSHSYSHRIMRWMLPWDIAAELRQSDAALYNSAGVRTRLLRHPGGMQGVFLPFAARVMGRRVVTWSIDPRDYAQPGSAELARRVLEAAHPGAIILLHDGSPGGDENRRQTVEALPAIIEGLRAKGYQFVAVW